ncbi:MAG TPA: hypothetical protein VLJ15_04780 [Gammaproteobacteria bacterium]|nr:hypothetical protein [Gammaproteobacteria bacterium]
MYGSIFTPSSGTQDAKDTHSKRINIDSGVFSEFGKILKEYGSLGNYFDGYNIRIHSSSAREIYYYHMDKGIFKTGKFEENAVIKGERGISEELFFGLQRIHNEGDLEGRNICEKQTSPHPFFYYHIKNGALQEGENPDNTKRLVMGGTSQ